MEYRLNPVYGTHPTPILHDGNRREHLVDYEGSEERRPMTREERQLLFEHIDDRVERMIKRGRKGALTAYRDPTLFETLYGWGLRASEASGPDVVDLYRNARRQSSAGTAWCTSARPRGPRGRVGGTSPASCSGPWRPWRTTSSTSVPATASSPTPPCG